MALLYFCLISLFCTLNASILRTEFQNVGRTRDTASDYCERTYYQGYLAPWQEIVNTRTGSLQIWDGNSYQLSPLITILGCTNDTGSSHHTIPARLHWSKTAAQCQGMCLTTVFAIRGTDCHCLGESYIPANDIDCLPMIARSPALNSQNSNAKTVFKTVSLGINGPSTDRCLAQNNSNGCNYEFRSCQDQLRMMCKAGTTVPDSWPEATYSCTSFNSFPRPVSDVCIPGMAGTTGWYGGFRLLQYIPGSTDGTFCKRLSYLTQYADPTFKEVSCDSSFRFYCRYTESVYNEPCDVTIPTSCDVNFICSDRTGTPKCLCTGDKYWDDTNRSCRTRRIYDQSCDVSIPDVCADGLSCQISGGSYTCHCEGDRYLDPNSDNCESRRLYGNSCDTSIPDVCADGLSCQSSGGSYTCHCKEDRYLDPKSEDCEPRKSHDENCDASISDVCQDGLSCQSTDADNRCRCSEDMIWNPTSRSCQTRRTYNQSCFDGIPGFCVDGLSCQFSDGNFKCLCSSNEYFDDKNSITCILRKTYAESCDTSIQNVCADRLSCLSKEESFQCLCNTTLYLDPDTKECVSRKAYGQACDNSRDDVCEEKMTCASHAGLHLCGCDNQHYWDGASLQCLPLLTYGGDCLEDKQCSPGLTCNGTSSESNKKCICVTGSYWDRTDSCIIKITYGQSCDASIPDVCADGLSCQSSGGSNICLCKENRYLDPKSGDCEPSKSYGQLCNTTVEDICQRTMVCQPRAGRNVCVCDNKHHWDGEAFVCQPVTTDISDKASCSIICTSNTSRESTSDTQRYRVMLIIFMVVDALMTIGFVAMFVYVVRLRLQRPRATT